MSASNDPQRLSVVIAASDSAAAVARCVASLAPILGRVEVIVAAARDRMVADEGPPGVTWVTGEPGASVPRLRRLGLDRATGPVIAFTEDSCQLAPGWADAWCRAFASRGIEAATGPVEHAPGRSVVDWSVFFCEYAPFLHPDPKRPVTRLAGNNFAVRRDVLGPSDEVHEGQVFEEVTRRRGGCVTVAGAMAHHVRRYGLGEAIADRLRFGHGYGRLRAAGRPLAWRFLGLIAGPAILLAQAGRLTLTPGWRRGYAGRFLETLPATLALLSAWSVGEWLGWMRGPSYRRRGRVARRPEPGPGRAAMRRRGYERGRAPA